MKTSQIIKDILNEDNRSFPGFEIRVYSHGEYIYYPGGSQFAVIGKYDPLAYSEFLDDTHKEMEGYEDSDPEALPTTNYVVWDNRDFSTPFTDDDLRDVILYYEKFDN